MKEHPILFSGEMVRAILDGRKTQTRRTRGLEQMNRHPDLYDKTTVDADGKVLMRHKDGSWVINWGKSPYGIPGDQLWVRETWGAVWPDDYPVPLEQCKIEYRADLPSGSTDYPGAWPADDAKGNDDAPKWRSSMFMHRKFSRILLEIVSVRVERVREISHQDLFAEGIYQPRPEGWLEWELREEYQNLWDRLNGKRGYSWDSNPWTWVIEFKRIEP
jgi:hypothetical protein